MKITGERLGSNANVSGRLASSGMRSSAKSSRFLRTSTSAASMSVPQVKLMMTIEVPCREVDCTVSTLSTEDRKSTRLNSSHVKISYAVFCLKKKKRYHTLHEKQKLHT